MVGHSIVFQSVMAKWVRFVIFGFALLSFLVLGDCLAPHPLTMTNILGSKNRGVRGCQALKAGFDLPSPVV